MPDVGGDSADGQGPSQVTDLHEHLEHKKIPPQTIRRSGKAQLISFFNSAFPAKMGNIAGLSSALAKSFPDIFL